MFFYPLANFKSNTAKTILRPPVSIVICAKNELENLKANLLKVLNQNYPDFEVIVVDDHSTDGSLAYLKELKKSHSKLKVLSFNQDKLNDGKKEALAFGIENAKNEHLLLSDADCYPLSEHWITSMISEYSNHKSIVLGVSLYHSKKTNFLSKVVEMDAIIIAVQYLSFALIGKAYMSVGRNVSYLKSVYLKNNGFLSHLNISSGDDDLFIRDSATNNNVGIVIQQSAQTASAAKNSWKSFIHQKKRHQSTGIYYKKSTLFLLASFQILTLFFYVSCLTALILSNNTLTLLTILFLKLLVKASIFKRILLKIGVRKNWLPFLFYDILWVFLIIYLNISNLFRLQKKW